MKDIVDRLERRRGQTVLLSKPIWNLDGIS
jgi:hypothetical protein